ncbi:MAG: hypothetical protein KC425_22830, partial [Anaerolineales bacterium]|nr:hypothetical protein [Anaerolineales bacterium]
CVEQALATGDFSFGAYRAKLRQHRLGRLLKRRTIVARSLYLQHAPRFWLTLWQLAAIAPTRVQRLVGASLGLLPR